MLVRLADPDSSGKCTMALFEPNCGIFPKSSEAFTTDFGMASRNGKFARGVQFLKFPHCQN
ncbi:unnamed protein product [Ixodes pacificus]